MKKKCKINAKFLRGIELKGCISMILMLISAWFIFLFQVCVRAGIYHGSEALCDIMSTRPEGGSNPSWNEYLDCDLDVNNIPRMARLCLVIYSVYVDRRKTRAKRKEVNVQRWGIWFQRLDFHFQLEVGGWGAETTRQ